MNDDIRSYCSNDLISFFCIGDVEFSPICCNNLNVVQGNSSKPRFNFG